MRNYILKVIGVDHEFYRAPPVNSVEHVYSAVEMDQDGNSTAVVCWRDKAGDTHQSKVIDDTYHDTKIVRPFKK